MERKRYENHLLYPITRYGNHFVVFNSKLIVKLMSVTQFSVMVMLVLNFLLLMQQTPKFWKKFQKMSSVDFLFQYNVKDVTKMHVLCKICQWHLHLRPYHISIRDSIFHIRNIQLFTYHFYMNMELLHYLELIHWIQIKAFILNFFLYIKEILSF